jgi:hypothetical protein
MVHVIENRSKRQRLPVSRSMAVGRFGDEVIQVYEVGGGG